MSFLNKRLMPHLLLVFLWQSAAAETPSPYTIRTAATNYEHGRDGVKKDYRQAFQLYCEAALKDDIESAYSLGFMYFNGRGVPRNLGSAMHWFKRAAEGGDQHARNMLTKFSGIETIDDGRCKPKETTLWLTADSNPNVKIIKNWVDQIAPHFDIDPDLVMAVIRAESAFNIKALSNKNAQGLMQLIPETAERFGVKNSWDPVQNIKGGVAYLHWLLRHFDGKVDLVLAAYNAGEGAVERYNGVPPYRETQTYVKKILTWYPKALHPVPTERNAADLVVQQKL